MEDEPSPASGIEAFRDLERYLSGAVGGLAEIERESERRGREILRLALQAHIDARGDGDVGQAIVVVGEDGPVRLAHKRVHRRAVVTLFGEVSVTPRRVRRARPRGDPSAGCRADAPRRGLELRVPAAADQGSHLRAV